MGKPLDRELTALEKLVCWEKGTEAPFSGKYCNHNEDGIYSCLNCGSELFSSEHKFDSACGWPSFDNELGNETVKKQFDDSHGMRRTEVLCNHCGAHLGHLFDDGPTATGARYCVNSASLSFEENDNKDL